jgi:hypothetical protein
LSALPIEHSSAIVQVPALSATQRAYCLARARGLSHARAAERAGVTERGAYKWLARPELRDALRAEIDRLQDGVRDEVLRHFRGHAMRAAERITECMEPGRAAATGELNLKAALAALKFVAPEPAGSAGGGTTVNVGVAVNVGLDADERARRLSAVLARVVAG